MSAKLDKKRYIFDSILSALNNTIASALIAFIFIPLIISNIGANNYGIWAIVSAFTGLAGLGDFGLSKAVVYFLSGKAIGVKRNLYFSAAFLINISIVFVILMIAILLLFSNVDLFSGNQEISQELGRYILLVGSACLTATIIMGFVKALMEASFKLSLANNLSLLLTFLIYVPVYIASFWTKDLFFLIGFFGVANFFVLTLHLIFTVYRLNFSFVMPSKNLITKVLRHSLGFLTIGIINILLLPICRYFIISKSPDGVAHAIFDLATKIAFAATSVLMSFCAPLFSLFSSNTNKNIQNVVSDANRFSKRIFILFCLGNFIFFLVGEFICEIMMPSHYKDLYIITSVILFCVGFTACSEPYVRALWGYGKVHVSALIKSGLIFFNLVLLYLLSDLTPLIKFSFSYSVPFFIVSLIYVVYFHVRFQKSY